MSRWKPEEEKEADFWTCDEDAERLTYEDMDEAIEYFLDDLLSPKMTAQEVVDVLPKTIEVYGYVRDTIKPESYKGHVLEWFLETLDEEYGDPDGDLNDPTPGMQEAERVFIEAVLKEYVAWPCKKICTKTINTLKWVKENNPDWLED